MDQGPNYDWTTIWSMLPKKAQESLVNPVAKAIGDGVGGIFTWVFHKPIEYMAVEQAKVESLKHMTAEKLSKIPENKMDFSKRGLMVKALEDSKYSLDNELMREYFSTLIAKAANKDTANLVSPYFSTILSNMSVRDAKFLEHFKNTQSLAIVKIRFTDSKAPKNFTDYKQDYILNKNVNAKEENIEVYSEEIDALESLGVVKRKYGQINESEADDIRSIFRHIKNKHLEKNLAGHFELELNSDKKQEIFINKHPYDTVQTIPGSLDLTELGKSFVRMVLL